ncbi:uncharacterized protein N7473_012411 [Penicillium subrubescens]|uniref:uncharacterized protein n=1 Tax=Penicillium subrubescens TaxID=1316194 RepID=UPI002545834C|nr:uncharacterized protein N7473_012411 [Penicillium subrubescens]KAJ5875064.1 hypothetical protein N7473_012411 [Penicillium subrubescens]
MDQTQHEAKGRGAGTPNCKCNANALPYHEGQDNRGSQIPSGLQNDPRINHIIKLCFIPQSNIGLLPLPFTAPIRCS